MFCNSIIKRGWSNHNSTGKVGRPGSPVQISFKYNFWTDVAWRREAATEKPLLLSSWIDRIREHLSVSHCNRYPESPCIRVERAKLSTREKLEYATAGHKWPRYLPGLAFFLGFTASMKHAKKKMVLLNTSIQKSWKNWWLDERRYHNVTFQLCYDIEFKDRMNGIG